MYDLSECHWQGLYRIPDKGKILPLLGFQGVAQLIRSPHLVIVDPVFAQIARHTQEPRLFMGAVFKSWGCFEKSEQSILQNLFRVAHVVQIGISQPEDAVAVLIQYALGLTVDLCPVCRPRRLRRFWNSFNWSHQGC